jgi:hypothetical protein
MVSRWQSCQEGSNQSWQNSKCCPTEEDFDILFRSAITNIVEKVEHPFVITIGFPFSTYNVFKSAAEYYLAKRHFMLDYDTRTFNLKGSVRKNTFIIDQYEVIPEIVGGIIGLKRLYPAAENENLLL